MPELWESPRDMVGELTNSTGCLYGSDATTIRRGKSVSEAIGRRGPTRLEINGQIRKSQSPVSNQSIVDHAEAELPSDLDTALEHLLLCSPNPTSFP